MTSRNLAASTLACTLLCSASAIALSTAADPASAVEGARSASPIMISAAETPEEKAARLKKERALHGAHPPAASGTSHPPAADGAATGAPVVKKPAATSVPTINPRKPLAAKKVIVPPGGTATAPVTTQPNAATATGPGGNPAFQKNTGVNPAFTNQKAVNPAFAGSSGAAATPTAAPKLDAIKSARTVTTKGNRTVIKEPGNRTIVKQGNKISIQHNEATRLQQLAPNAQTKKQPNGNNVTIINRNNYQIYNVTDSGGNLLQRYRQGPDGNRQMLINNEYGGGGREEHRDHFGRNLAIGLGVGAGVVAGAYLLHELTEVHEPHYDVLPPERYVVRYDRASDDDVYETLTAPPIERLERAYTLDEVRATYALRQHMRRIDLDDINFETGSWSVEPVEIRKLERIARGMQRAIDRNPNEVFMIEGYTDAVGAPEDNLSLSDHRAEAVAEVLSREFNVPPENIVTQGYGEQYLKIQTQGPERENRRVAVRRITPLMAKDHD
jgi:outer membrane protein OmpA-like peptidoglycan-associated protein